MKTKLFSFLNVRLFPFREVTPFGRAAPPLARDPLLFAPLVPLTDPQDDVEAMKLYQKEADQGDAVAQFNLGTMYQFGINGILPPDDAEAMKWYQKAAQQGNEEAINALADRYAALVDLIDAIGERMGDPLGLRRDTLTFQSRVHEVLNDGPDPPPLESLRELALEARTLSMEIFNWVEGLRTACDFLDSFAAAVPDED